jgi:nitrite reductase (NADH) large subunit
MRYVIIGNGVAGDSAAGRIRELDREGSVDIFTKESVPFYYRPRLIDYLAGEVPIEKFTLHRESWYLDRSISLHLSTEVVSIDPDRHTVTTGGGQSFEYDRLLIATGADNFIPPIRGVDENRDRIFTVRDKKDVDTILKKLEPLKEVIVIGGGLLGLETANSLRKLGKLIKVVEFFPRLLPRQLDIDGAALLQKNLGLMGFEFHLGEVSESIEGSDRCLTLTLKSGKKLEGDLIIVSAGVRPDLSLARKAGIEVNKGIVVNDSMQTAVEGIYGAGDVAEHRGVLYGIWPPAKEQGEIAGTVMAGGQAVYSGTLPSHKLKVVGIDLLSMGEIDAEGKLESAISKDDGKFIYRKAVISDGKVKGAILLGDTSGDNAISKAIRDGLSFDDVRQFFAPAVSRS